MKTITDMSAARMAILTRMRLTKEIWKLFRRKGDGKAADFTQEHVHDDDRFVLFYDWL